MEHYLQVLTVVVPVMTGLLLGILARVRSLISPQGVDGLKALVMNFCLPAVLLRAFYTADFSFGFFAVTAVMIVCCLAGLGFGYILRRVTNLRMLPFLTTGFEAGMMGYGLYTMLFGVGEMHNFAMVDLGQVLFVFTVYTTLLNREKEMPPRQAIMDMVRSPVFLAILAGVVLAATGLGSRLAASTAGDMVASLLDYLATPTGMLMIFVVGYGLKLQRDAAKAALLTVALRAAIMALLCIITLWLAGLVMPMTDPLLWAIVLMFSLPAPFVLPLYSGQKDEEAYVSTSLSLGALLSIVVFAIISVVRM